MENEGDDAGAVFACGAAEAERFVRPVSDVGEDSFDGGYARSENGQVYVREKGCWVVRDDLLGIWDWRLSSSFGIQSLGTLSCGPVFRSLEGRAAKVNSP